MELFNIFIKLIVLLAGMVFLIVSGSCFVGILSVIILEDNVGFKEILEILEPLIFIVIFFALCIIVTLLGYIVICYLFIDKNNKTMDLTTFLQAAQTEQPICFDETMAVIAKHYHYQATEFSNGLGEDKLTSAAGTNEGSCKIFAFAQLHHLTPKQTLNLFGGYYHLDVLHNPTATDHQNIRLFMKYGWDGIRFQNPALTPK